ncbi:DUF348 domain-containing protein [bacterium]|nr:DUF348 domain-containing protein [bacterium]
MKIKFKLPATKIKQLPGKLKKFNVRSAVRRVKNIDKETIKTRGKHPYAVPVITFVGLTLIIGLVYLVARQTNQLPKQVDNKIVIVSYDKNQRVVPVKQSTVGDLLNKLNIKINEGDVVEPAVATKINQDQFRINVYRAVPVQIVDGENKVSTFSAATTPRAIAQQVGQNVYPEDKITAEPVQDFVRSGAIGEQIIITRSIPVNVDLYGTPVTMRTQSKTVGELVKEKNIVLTKDDKLSLPANTPITPNMQLGVLRTGVKVVTLAEEIPSPVQTINDPNLAYGTTAIRQNGSSGQQTVTYQITLNNNKEVDRKVIQKIINKQAVKTIKVVGTSISGIKGDMALAGISPGDYAAADYIISHESGWRPYAGNASGAYGLCQALPGAKMASAGADWATNPVTQLKWCNGYASSRYGGWQAAYNHWMATRNW